jgi:hypothetical protein
MKISFGTIICEDNALGGLYVLGNVDVEMERGEFRRNGGHGIYVEGQVTPFLELISRISNEVANNQALAPQASAIQADLENVNKAVQAPGSTKAGIKAMLVTIKDKVLENSGVLAAHALISLFEQAPALIDKLQHLG